MYTGLLIFTGGVLVKTFLTLIHNFKKEDWVGVVIAIFGSLLALGSSTADDTPVQTRFLVLLVSFIAIIAFTFKDRILPKVTEGTLLLYGIVSLYLFETHLKSEAMTYVITEWVLIIYCLIIFILCITRVRIRPLIQIFLFICFLLLNLAIMSVFIQYGNFNLFCNTCSTNNLDNLGIFFTGYAFFNLASNLIFVLYFIPIPLWKHQSIRQRIYDIKAHARDLEKKYIDIDIGFNRTILISVIAILLYLNHLYQLVDSVLITSLALIFGETLTSSSNKEEANTVK